MQLRGGGLKEEHSQFILDSEREDREDGHSSYLGGGLWKFFSEYFYFLSKR